MPVWFMTRYRKEQLAPELYEKICNSIPNRLAFIDSLNLGVSPNFLDTDGNIENQINQYEHSEPNFLENAFIILICLFRLNECVNIITNLFKYY
jgi:hypothetical protein